MNKKEVILLLVILLSFLLITDLIRNLTINAFIFRNVNTKATSEDVSVSLRVKEWDNCEPIYSGYNGNTTNFDSYNDTELQDISNLTLEKENYGKIIFNENINLTDCGGNYGENPCHNSEGNYEIDLNSYCNLSYNKIYINTSHFRNLEKPATLYLYDLPYTNPRILRDSSVCPDTICRLIDYSGGTLIFDVTQFSEYSAEESRAAVVEGRGPPSTIYPKHVTLPEPMRKPGKFFDAKITIPEKYRTLTQGERLIAEINLINTQRIGLVDVVVDYYIKDLEDEIIYHEYETKAVERTITYLKEFDTSNLKSGTYMLIIEVKYDLDKAVAGYPITILEKPHLEQPVRFISKDFITYIILALLTIVIIIVIYQTIQIKKLSTKRISEKELAKAGYIKKR